MDSTFSDGATIGPDVEVPSELLDFDCEEESCGLYYVQMNNGQVGHGRATDELDALRRFKLCNTFHERVRPLVCRPMTDLEANSLMAKMEVSAVVDPVIEEEPPLEPVEEEASEPPPAKRKTRKKRKA